MNNIEMAYQFFLRVEEKMNKKLDKKNSGRRCVGRSGIWCYGGINDDQKRKYEVSNSNHN